MKELVINIHMHSVYSDGCGTYSEIATAAIEANLDAVIITDHNVLVQGLNGYYQINGKRTLILTGEEIHDQDRDPQKNHLLVFGVSEEAATFSDHPQLLIDQINQMEGLSFIAHPVDLELKLFNESNISWEDWNIQGFTGIEIWNGLSEIKNVINSKFEALIFGLFPELIAHGPTNKTIEIWDNLLSKGKQVVAIGGSDAHAMQIRFGPLRKIIFPYKFHFSSINTHLLIQTSLTGDLSKDSNLIISALAKGHAYVGYDLPAPTNGFRFYAQSKDQKVSMGDKIESDGKITIQVHSPAGGQICLLKDGEIIKTSKNPNLVHITDEPGVYRVEVHRNFLGKKRGWIFSNPIYVVPGKNTALRKSTTL
jgi:hypothetical protein